MFSSRILMRGLFRHKAAPKTRRISTLGIAGITATLAYGAGAMLPRPAVLDLLFPRPLPSLPHLDSDEGRAYVAALDKELFSSEVYKSITERKVTPEEAEKFNVPAGSPYWTENRPYHGEDPSNYSHSLTRFSLRTSGGIPTLPVLFASPDRKDFRIILFLGHQLCGHPGIIHGGLLATVCDESLALPALYNFPTNIGVTANLNIKYRNPTSAGQFVLVETSLDELNGRKASVSARIKTVAGVLLVEASALFVEPRWAAYMPAPHRKWMK